jgi:GxxExxY protein
MQKDALLTRHIISAAIEVHRHLGPGLLESTYEACLCREFRDRGIAHRRQVPLPVCYKGLVLDCGYRLDLVVENAVVVELKVVSELQKIHEAQLLTYLRMTGMKLGLLLNFNVLLMKHGIKRMANGV